MSCLSHDCDLLPSVSHGNLLCKRKIICVAVSVISLLPTNEQADGRLSISFDRNQIRRKNGLCDKAEERMNPFVPGLPELAFSL